MNLPSKPRFGLTGLLALYAITTMSSSLQAAVAWGKAQSQAPAWYASDEAAQLADSVLTYQHPSGGWPKNTDMTQPAPKAGEGETKKGGTSAHAPTIDNGATTSQLNFLARLINQRAEKRWVESFNRGMDYLFAAQLSNGGWAQFYPERKGYYSHITFNDNAMARVMQVLYFAKNGKGTWAFVDEARRTKAAAAYDKGIACILRCQVVIDGKKTAWCAQHDENTFAPAAARKFEPISLSGSETMGLIEVLMDVEKPAPEVIEAVHAAMAWVDKVKLTGMRYEKVPAPELKGGFDKVVIEDPAAKEPYWARFYEIPSMKPIFMGRDAVVHYKVSEIEHERRVGYAWYVTEGRNFLERKYPKWKAKLAPATKN